MKRLKKIGVIYAYSNEENTPKAFRCLLALPLLPVTDIDLTFEDVTALPCHGYRQLTVKDPAGAILLLCVHLLFYLVFHLSVVF